jgi:hypothetical protein
MKKPVIIDRTYRLISLDTENLEITENQIWLSKTQRGSIYTLRGVPSSQLDIVIVNPIEGMVQIVDLCRKIGKFDERIRQRITIRNVPAHQAPIQCVAVYFALDDQKAFVHVGQEKFEFGRYRHKLDNPDRVGNIVRWHFSRYYTFLCEAYISEVEKEFTRKMLNGSYTLAEANRLASRMLYRKARESGFRKLTKREQLRLSLSGQWHTEAQYAEAQKVFSNGKFHASGTGLYTRKCANGIGGNNV